VLVLCLPSLEATQAVLFGPGGAAHEGARGVLVLECSTLMPNAALDFDARLDALGIGFADAPVTRGPTEALAGKLNALLGGRPEHAALAGRVLSAFCERVFSFGAPGQGYAAKLVSNFLAFTQLAAVAEGMATAARAGLDLPLLLQALAVSGSQSRVLDGLAPVIADTGESRSRVTLATAHKDVAYYRRFADALHTAGPVAAQVEQQFAQALAAGLGQRFTPDYLRHVAASCAESAPGG
jgi:3-hydroxyisobutyrate dehydrogenase-like beta-hydroxyacid dehydrogenase